MIEMTDKEQKELIEEIKQEKIRELANEYGDD